MSFHPDDMKIRVINFFTTYPVKGGEVKEVDWVEFTTPGMAGYQINVLPMKEVLGVIPLTQQNSSNVAIAMANQRKAQIEPKYNAWKQGKELPEDGTPLEAWAGVSPQQIEALKNSGFRTVEELAEAGDGAISRINLPNRSQFRDLAARWLKSQDAVKAAADLEERDRQISELQAQMAEMQKLITDNKPKKTTRKKTEEAA